MMLPASETAFALMGAMLDRLLHMGEGAGALLLGFVLDRLEFVAHNPASAMTGLFANLFIGWWLTHDKQHLPLVPSRR
jgi:predicted MFS family arabinose efflux permease